MMNRWKRIVLAVMVVMAATVIAPSSVDRRFRLAAKPTIRPRPTLVRP